MKTTALLLLVLPFILLAQDTFEHTPTLSAAAIRKSEFAAGGGFAVRDPAYGGRNGYTTDSDAGLIEVDSNASTRVPLLGAKRLPKMDRSVRKMGNYEQPTKTRFVLESAHT